MHRSGGWVICYKIQGGHIYGYGSKYGYHQLSITLGEVYSIDFLPQEQN